MTLFMTEIHVEDPIEVANWYSRVLGLRIAHRDEPKGFLLLEAPGGGRLAVKRKREQSTGARGVRLIFGVEDVSSERDRLLGLGEQVGEPAENSEEHYREIRLTDPEGTRITIFCWTDR
jgi:predicted enzyme related to lactoylglutathione lyase